MPPFTFSLHDFHLEGNLLRFDTQSARQYSKLCIFVTKCFPNKYAKPEIIQFMIFRFCTHHICPHKAVENKIMRQGKYTRDLTLNVKVTPSREK